VSVLADKVEDPSPKENINYFNNKDECCAGNIA
jgi:hypothetical protein